MTVKTLVLAWTCLLLAILCSADIIYVDEEASPGGNGESWGTAYKHIQDGLDDSTSGDQIWVAEGTYKPTSRSGRTESFHEGEIYSQVSTSTNNLYTYYV